MSEIYFYIILALICSICGFIIVNLLRKLEAVDDELESLSSNYLVLFSRLRQLKDEIYEIDSKQIFEKDDEVGVIFDGIKEAIDQANRAYGLESDEE